MLLSILAILVTFSTTDQRCPGEYRLISPEVAAGNAPAPARIPAEINAGLPDAVTMEGGTWIPRPRDCWLRSELLYCREQYRDIAQMAIEAAVSPLEVRLLGHQNLRDRELEVAALEERARWDGYWSPFEVVVLGAVVAVLGAGAGVVVAAVAR